MMSQENNRYHSQKPCLSRYSYSPEVNAIHLKIKTKDSDISDVIIPLTILLLQMTHDIVVTLWELECKGFIPFMYHGHPRNQFLLYTMELPLRAAT